MGKIIVIEGCDGSGKATQTKLLYEYLKNAGYAVKMVSYPNYDSDSSALTKMYLNGEFGSDANDVNPYVASSFYAVDRFASYLKEWKSFYEQDDAIVICDRYVTSNMLHQTSKMPKDKRLEFLEWEYDYEYVKGGLPVPDEVIFLDVLPETTFKLMKERENKITHEQKKDIHEANPEFLTKSYENSFLVSDLYGWERILCCDKNGKLKSEKEIHSMIVEYITSCFQ